MHDAARPGRHLRQPSKCCGGGRRRPVAARLCGGKPRGRGGTMNDVGCETYTGVSNLHGRGTGSGYGGQAGGCDGRVRGSISQASSSGSGPAPVPSAAAGQGCKILGRRCRGLRAARGGTACVCVVRVGGPGIAGGHGHGCAAAAPEAAKGRQAGRGGLGHAVGPMLPGEASGPEEGRGVAEGAPGIADPSQLPAHVAILGSCGADGVRGHAYQAEVAILRDTGKRGEVHGVRGTQHEVGCADALVVLRGSVTCGQGPRAGVCVLGQAMGSGTVAGRQTRGVAGCGMHGVGNAALQHRPAHWGWPVRSQQQYRLRRHPLIAGGV